MSQHKKKIRRLNDMGLISSIPTRRWDGSTSQVCQENLANESLISIVINGEVLTHLLASDDSIIELVTGHLFLEYGLEQKAMSIVDISTVGEQVLVKVESTENLSIPSSPRVVTTSCGACDAPDVEGLMSTIPIVDDYFLDCSMSDFQALFENIQSQSEGFRSTGGMHSASVLCTNGRILVTKEDIGRHNAIDKCIGTMMNSVKGVKPGALMVSGRIGWDIVAKAGRSGIGVIISLGAASSLAAAAARSSNITLISFFKHTNAVIIGSTKLRLRQ